VKVDPKLDGQWEEKEKVFCLVANGRRRFFSTSSHFPPKQLHLNLHFLSFDIKVLLYHGPRPLFTHALPFPWPINYDHISWCHNYPHLHYRFDFFEDFSSLAWNYGVVIVTFYGPQAAQVNEEPPSESSLDLTLTQHPCDEELKLRKVWTYLEVEPLQVGYYCISSNSRTLVILFTNQPCFRWRTWNCLQRLLRNQRHFYLRLVFSSWRWTLSLVARSDSSTAF
jgi:hypothetical protein